MESSEDIGFSITQEFFGMVSETDCLTTFISKAELRQSFLACVYCMQKTHAENDCRNAA